jgi:hypothetical protein
MGTNRFFKPRVALIAAILACVALAMFASCKGSTSQPSGASQVATGQSGAITHAPSAAPAAGGLSAGGAPGAMGKPKGAADSTKPGSPPPSGAAGKEAPAGPKVEVTDLLVDSPGIDFTGPGRYDVTIAALLSEPWKAGVWDVIAYGEDGKEVGKQEVFLALSEFKPKTLMFNDFYCDSIPVKIALMWTDKKGDRSEAGPGKSENANGKGPVTPGGGSAKPGAGGETKPPPPPAGGGKGGDKGGSGDGGDATTE